MPTRTAFNGTGTAPCHCAPHGPPRFVVVTGGPGAGKTAILELAKRRFCEHVRVLPEAASMLFGGGFPRLDDREALEAAQVAIFHVERNLERAAAATNHASVVLCDRGTLDGLAYWPDAQEKFFAAVGTSADVELARYHAVVHLRTPDARAYNHHNALRTETVTRARALDVKIGEAWARHPRVIVVEPRSDFLDKARDALAVIAGQVPVCCGGTDAPASG